MENNIPTIEALFLFNIDCLLSKTELFDKLLYHLETNYDKKNMSMKLIWKISHFV